MTDAEELMLRSKYHPGKREIRTPKPPSPTRNSINPESFPYAENEYICLIHTTETAIQVIQKDAAIRKEKFPVVFFGIKDFNEIKLVNYALTKPGNLHTNYSDRQMKLAAGCNAKANGIVVYAHSHPSDVKSYNYFSINDLTYLIEEALRTYDHSYGMLITPERVFAVKYDYVKLDFFRLKIRTKEHGEL